ncbi:MAG: Xaa-Pro aminopeptidase [Actinomycetia bacterium]|nr:Xaa-Pro aminopeptidase [Actinomycetes bacterium]
MSAAVVLPPHAIEIDTARMRRDRHAKLVDAMDQTGFDALVLGGTGNVNYAVGSTGMSSDVGRAFQEPTIAVVTRDGLHLFTPYPEGAPPELPADRIHDPLYPEFPEGVAALAGALRDVLGGGGITVGFDEMSAAAHALLPAAVPGLAVADASLALTPAKLYKTGDELECMRRAQYINEVAMYDVLEALRPGARQSDLSGILFRRIFELGAAANSIDPIWQVMPSAIADGPFTVHGDVAFPTNSTDRILREGETLFVDSGIVYEGYCSDFGRTWFTGERIPDAKERDRYSRWKDVIHRVLAITKPGTTGLELNRAAREGEDRKPWLDHFYLVHGLGTESAEMPFIGTDLGEEFDESIVLQPGMVMVLEPVIWDDGDGGYRSEDIVAVTDDGYRLLSSFPYVPFETGAVQW